MNTVQIFDGAMGSMLLAAGLPPGAAPDEWNVTHPDVVRRVHQLYAKAGAHYATTNTFGCNSIRLKTMKLDGRAAELNRHAVQLARDGAGECLIAGDIGPTGEMLAPLGPLPRDIAFGSFEEQARILSGAGVDIFLVETFFCLEEALLAVEAVRQVSEKPIWASLTFRSTPRGFFTTYGDRPVPALRSLLDRGVTSVGANCTLSSQAMVALAQELAPQFGDMLFFQPNAGEPEIVEDQVVYPETPEEFAAHCAAIAALGVGAVGGCCGSTPSHIRELVAAIHGHG